MQVVQQLYFALYFVQAAVFAAVYFKDVAGLVVFFNQVGIAYAFQQQAAGKGGFLVLLYDKCFQGLGRERGVLYGESGHGLKLSL